MIVVATDVSVRYPRADAESLVDVDLTLGPGELVAVTGPNGCGKTTLIRGLLGLTPLTRGSVFIDGRPLPAWRRAELAQLVALVPQREETPFSWRVREMVGFGRYARLGALSAMSREDSRAVAEAMARCDVSGLGDRAVETLSGGEWQRVRIARALAQEPRLLVLDEPTASLDLGHEMALFELVRKLVGEGLSALVVTHHLNLAARYAGRILLLDSGRVVAAGSPAEVMGPDLLSRVFRWPVTVVTNQDAPQIVPLRPAPPGHDYS
jgi:iron complex transport system ATP-binding protein